MPLITISLGNTMNSSNMSESAIVSNNNNPNFEQPETTNVEDSKNYNKRNLETNGNEITLDEPLKKIRREETKELEISEQRKSIPNSHSSDNDGSDNANSEQRRASYGSRYVSMFGKAELDRSNVSTYVFEDAIDPERVKLHASINFAELKIPQRPLSAYSSLFDCLKPAAPKTTSPNALSEKDQEEIFQVIRKTFIDTFDFDSEYAPAVKMILAGPIPDREYSKRLMQKHFPDLSIANAIKFRRANEIIKTTCTLMLFYIPAFVKQFVVSKEDFFKRYPQFADETDEEKSLLIKFCNALRMALVLIPPSQNKGLLMNIAARLEGSGKDYVVGGGQKIETGYRVMIYETEGKVTVRHRIPRHLQNRRQGDCELPRDYLEEIVSRSKEYLSEDNNSSN